MNYQELSQQYGFPTYPSMVASMAKPMGSPAADMLHMAIGMSGEHGEMMQAGSRENFLEECGDLEFYFEGLSQCLKKGYDGIFNVDDPRNLRITLGNVHYNLQTLTADILDLCKKPWVYNTREPKYLELYDLMFTLRNNLLFLYKVSGTNLDEIIFGNQVKLKGTPDQKGRYASGTYSDEQAQARADKT